jgi:hypothetical protein
MRITVLKHLSVPSSECRIDGCFKAKVCRDMCSMHYRRWKKSGDPGGSEPLRAWGHKNDKCKIADCNATYMAKGYCRTHYYRIVRYGDPSVLLKVRRYDGAACAVAGCDSIATAKGLCRLHRERQKRSGTTDAPRRKRRADVGDSYVDRHGYVRVKTAGHPNAYATGWILEHVLVMSNKLGRALLPGENVHHRNGIKTDNDPSNLELWVTVQPTGQRPEDLLEWAVEIFRRYSPERTVNVSTE